MPDIEYWIDEIAKTGTELHEMGAARGGSGSISLFLPADTMGLRGFCLARFPRVGPYHLPDDLQLPQGTLLITGAGQRLRDIRERSDAVLAAIQVEPDGSAWLHHAKKHSVTPTFEASAHVGIQAVQLGGVPRVSAIVRAQPPNVTYLSHIPSYQEQARFNRQIYRWLPETITMIPEGIRVLGFEALGDRQQGELTRESMVRHRVVLWAKRGVVARSKAGPREALDLIAYVENAATYERLDLQAGRPVRGLTLDELRAIARRAGVQAPILESLPQDVLPATSPVASAP